MVKNAAGDDIPIGIITSQESGKPPSIRHHLFFSTHNALQDSRPSEYTLNLYVTERNGTSNVKLAVFPFHDVELVKRMLIKALGLPKSTNVKDICLFYGGTELHNRRSMNPFAAQRKRVRLEWDFRDANASMGIKESGMKVHPELKNIINDIQLSMKRGIKPKLVDDGCGGTYMMYDTNRRCVAMFKPRDEEPFAPNNPRGHINKLCSTGFRPGVVSGEGAVREVVAYLLDSQIDTFCGVPCTCKVEACHECFNYAIDYDYHDEKPSQPLTRSKPSQLIWKEGSLQMYIPNVGTCADFDPKLYSITDAQRIAIHDIRLMNLDRNDGNLLVQRIDKVSPTESTTDTKPKRDSRLFTPDGKISKCSLVPIDHGLILPDVMDVNEVDLAWFHWPHVKLPTEADELFFIFCLEPEKDARRLARKMHIRAECLRTLRVTTRLLQIGSRMRLNLHQIARFMCRSWEDFDEPSDLENIVRVSIAQCHSATSYNGIIGGRVNSNSGLEYMMDLAVSNPSDIKRHQHISSSKDARNLETQIMPSKSSSFSAKTQSGVGAASGESCEKVNLTKTKNGANVDNYNKNGDFETEKQRPICINESSEIVSAGGDSELLQPTRDFSDSKFWQDVVEVQTKDDAIPSPSSATGNYHIKISPTEEVGGLDAQRQRVTSTSSSATTIEMFYGQELFFDTIEEKNEDEEASNGNSEFIIDSVAGNSESIPEKVEPESQTMSLSTQVAGSHTIIRGDSSLSCLNSNLSCDIKDHSDSNKSAKNIDKVEGNTDDIHKAVSNNVRRFASTNSSSDSESSDGVGSSDSDYSDGGSSDKPLFSKLSGVPLGDAARRELDKGRIQASGKELGAGDATWSTARTRKHPGATSTRRGTRPHPSAASRKLTASAATRESVALVAPLSTWALLDSHKHVVPIDWTDRAVDRVFFEIFESHLKRQLRERHPNWKTYPYKGKEVEEEIAVMLRRHVR